MTKWLSDSLRAVWPGLTQRGVYYGAGYLVTGGLAAVFGLTAHGAIMMIAGMVLACTALAPWQDEPSPSPKA